MSDTDGTIPDAIREEARRLAGITSGGSDARRGEVRDYHSPGDQARYDLRILKDQATLPSSSSAIFMKIIGYCTVIASVFFIFQESPVLAAACVISGGFIVCAGHLHQLVFDLRTLMLRTSAQQKSGKP